MRTNSWKKAAYRVPPRFMGILKVRNIVESGVVPREALVEHIQLLRLIYTAIAQ